MKNFILGLLVSVMLICGCTIRPGDRPNQAQQMTEYLRQKLAELPEPTFETLEVMVHDYSALGTRKLVQKEEDARVPLRVLADSALSVLTVEVVTMVDVVELSNSLDEIKDGKVKKYLDIAWMMLELQGVVRRNDLTAQLTQREQRLLIALFKGVQLGTESADAVDRKLNAHGPRY